MRVAVAGGTGVAGGHVVRALTDQGHEVVVLARSRGVDITTGEGLDQALVGVQALVDTTNVMTLNRREATEFFETSTRHLLDAAQSASVGHLVALSIVGIDRVDTGYYAGKRRQEEVLRGGAVPFTILRATQFHDFPGQVLERTRGPVAFIPRVRMQPVAAAEVGARLADLATGPPMGDAPEMAGPEVHELVDLARRVSTRSNRRRPVVGLPVPGKTGRALAGGALLPTGRVTLGSLTFADWLADDGR